MISNPFYLLSVLISSLIAFFTVAFVVEMSIKIFNLDSPRLRSNLRILPFASLLVEWFVNPYSIANWLNPLSCVSCVQKLLLENLFPQLHMHLTENQISLIRYLSFGFDSRFFTSVGILGIVVSAVLVIYRFMHTFYTWQSVRSMIKRSRFCDRPIASVSLKETFKKNHVGIYLSDEVHVPMVAYPNNIILPKQTIHLLSSDEYEAVLAHEWEHVRHKDPLMRFAFHLLAALFWWIPTCQWIKKIEQDQELACDRNVINYKIKKTSIASALIKIAKQIKCYQTMCCFYSNEKSTLRRIKSALGVFVTSEPISKLNITGIVIGIFLLIACVCK